MATHPERLHQMEHVPDRDGDLFARYMRALLRSGRLAEHREDYRTCTHCGAFALFHPAGELGWSACSACGGIA